MHDLPPAPTAAELERVRSTVLAGHLKNRPVVLEAIGDPAPAVRQAGLGALVRIDGDQAAEDIAVALSDPDPQVRSRAAELAAQVGVDPRKLLSDQDPRVVEVACFACGEISDWAHSPPVQEISRLATSHEDALVRESASAALGAIGDPDGLEALLSACTDRVTVRRRAVLALAAFGDPRAEQALQRALSDKDWQVRQAAEDLLEVGRRLDP